MYSSFAYYSLLFPLSRCSRSAREPLELQLSDCPHSLVLPPHFFGLRISYRSVVHFVVYSSLDTSQIFASQLHLTLSTRLSQSARVFTMSSPARDVKPNIAELEQEASQEAPATPIVRTEKLNVTLSYGTQRESVYIPLRFFGSAGHYPTELRFALKPSAKARSPLHFHSLANGAFA